MLCICYDVTQADVEAAIAQGARTEEEIAEQCGAGDDCGDCAASIREILRRTPRGDVDPSVPAV